MTVAYEMQGCSDENLTKKLSKDFLYSFIPVELGRKELEEYLTVKWKTTLINRPPKRLLLRDVPYDF